MDKLLLIFVVGLLIVVGFHVLGGSFQFFEILLVDYLVSHLIGVEIAIIE